jgi:hypothetical protein
MLGVLFWYANIQKSKEKANRKWNWDFESVPNFGIHLIAGIRKF